MIGRRELGRSERIPLHGCPGLALLIPGGIEQEPEGGEDREQHQQRQANAEAGEDRRAIHSVRFLVTLRDGTATT